MNQDDIKTNLLDSGQWIRMLFMAGFAVAAWLVLLVLIVLVLVQTLIVLVSGEPNRNLRKVGWLFGTYLQQIIQYLCYNSSTKPFPFADFPAADEAADESDDEGQSAADADDPADDGVQYAAPEPEPVAAEEAPPPAPFHHSPDADEPQDPHTR